MNESLNLLTTFPTVIFTVLMVPVLLYWGMVILGALDIDFLDFGDADADGVGGVDGAEGTLDGLGDGAVEGALQGATEAADGLLDAAEGAAEAADGAFDAAEGAAEAADGATDAASDGSETHGGGLAALLTALRLRNAPVTITFSVLILCAWILTMLGVTLVGPHLSPLLSAWLLGSMFLLVAVLVAVPITSLSTRPLRRVFVVHQAPKRQTIIGKVCTVTTGRVDERFGQAKYDDGGAGMLFHVRCDPSHQLKKGDKALIISWDMEREVFVVEPYEELFRGNK